MQPETTTAPPVVRIPKEKLSDQIYRTLVTPSIPEKTNYKLHDRYWALSDDPSYHMEFSLIPDEDSLDGILDAHNLICIAGSMEGLDLFADIMQLKFVNKLMLLKSIAYSDTPNLMDRLTASMPSFRSQESERRPDTANTGLFGSDLMAMVRGRR